MLCGVRFYSVECSSEGRGTQSWSGLEGSLVLAVNFEQEVTEAQRGDFLQSCTMSPPGPEPQLVFRISGSLFIRT